jgi:signal transduction histidine kinase
MIKPAPVGTMDMNAAVDPVSDRTADPDAERRTQILVVDDDLRNLLAIETVLGGVADVVTAQSGEEALRHLLRDEFAVILLDVFMPGLDGYETARLIRQREHSRRIPIIFLTAIHKEDAQMLRGYDMGAVDYVFKPFEPLILRSKVSVFVDLFEKAREIREAAELKQRLMEENLRAQAERLEMERALRRSEEVQALILRSLPVALYTEERIGAGRTRSFVGGDLPALTGFERMDLEREGFWAGRVHPEDRAGADRFAAALMESGSAVSEYRWLCGDGQYRHFLDQAAQLSDGDRGRRRVAGTLLDVTTLRELENRLLQAQKLDALGKLTGGVAHDFNNLLAAVLGGLWVIERRTALGDDARLALERTRHAAEQGAELIRRMLAFSRRQQLQPKVVRMQDLRSTMEGLVGHVLGGLVRLEWGLDDTVWPAFVDSSQLELGLMNLILNARDAMPEGGTIRVSAANAEISADNALGLPAGDYVAITISDTGAGIAPENLERVLEPFFTTKEVGKGTGLGLSTTYGFARQSGGTLRVESTVGRGTRVELWLPRASGNTEARVPARDKPRSPRESAPVAASVLLVDDTPELLGSLAEVLRDQKFKVTTAAGGGEAIAMLEKNPDEYDIIVTDYAMPLVSGLDLIRFARSLRAEIPVILMTGHADSDALRNRPDDVPVLSKPFDYDDLAARVKAMVLSSVASR